MNLCDLSTSSTLDDVDELDEGGTAVGKLSIYFAGINQRLLHTNV